MEKYFIVTDQNLLRKDYMNCLQNMKEVNIFAKKFMEDRGIETHKYSCDNNAFYIIPTDKDLVNYSKMLMNDIGNGLRRFKKNSKIAKAWIQTVKNNNIKILEIPYVPSCFKNTYGHTRSNLFMIDNVVYCCFEIEHDFETPEGMTEIKASEYYRVIEDHEEEFK
ncbi:conserved protein of unknown function [Ruminococcaceae bacterium BL-6]|nr:conserved protein of unknown function [Ruminococcaceae bacterium BL-6]